MVSMAAFAVVHYLTISDIWFSLPIMAPLGAVVGAMLAWTFRVMGGPGRVGRWLAYCSCHLAVLISLGVVSLLVYEPVSNMRLLTGVLGIQEADRLVGEALPLLAVFTVVGSVAVTAIFGRAKWHVIPNLVTTALVMAFLGSNVVIIGLIELDTSATPALIELTGLTVVVVGVYALFMAGVVVLMAGRQHAEPVEVAL